MVLIRIHEFLRRFIKTRPHLHMFLRPWVRAAVGTYRWLHGCAAPLRFVASVLVDVIHADCRGGVSLLGAMWSSRGPGIGGSAGGNHVVMIVISDLRIDPRVEREARALADAGYEITVLYPDFAATEPNPASVNWGERISFRCLPARAAKYVWSWPGIYGSLLFQAAIEYRAFAFHAHDLNTSLVALAAARHTGAHAVCDFHEWHSENVRWSARKNAFVEYSAVWKHTYRWLERQCLRQASQVITVNESIARELHSNYGAPHPVRVVRNIPLLNQVPTQRYLPLKRQLNLPDESFVVLWQGGTGPTRHIEPIIECLRHIDDVVFVIRGYWLDRFGEGYKALARSAGVIDRVILLPPVPSPDVVAAARGADAGIWTLPALCKNFTYALPNKIFEYLAADLPVLAANYPEAQRLVEGYGVGCMFNPDDPRSIAGAIGALKSDPARRADMRRRAAEALAEIDADREWQKLVEIYAELEGRGRGATSHKRSSDPSDTCKNLSVPAVPRRQG